MPRVPQRVCHLPQLLPIAPIRRQGPSSLIVPAAPRSKLAFADGPCLRFLYILQPDYSYLRKLFRDLFVREAFQYDYVFDWSVQSRAEESDPAKAAAAAGGAAPAARPSGRRVIGAEDDGAAPGGDRQ